MNKEKESFVPDIEERIVRNEKIKIPIVEPKRAVGNPTVEHTMTINKEK